MYSYRRIPNGLRWNVFLFESLKFHGRHRTDRCDEIDLIIRKVAMVGRHRNSFSSRTVQRFLGRVSTGKSSDVTAVSHATVVNESEEKS